MQFELRTFPTLKKIKNSKKIPKFYLRQSLLHKIKLALVYKVDPTSPNRQSQQPHFRQSSCQYKSKAFNKKRSVIRLQQPAHSRKPIPELFVLPFPFIPPNNVFCIEDELTVGPVVIANDDVDNVVENVVTFDGTGVDDTTDEDEAEDKDVDEDDRDEVSDADDDVVEDTDCDNVC